MATVSKLDGILTLYWKFKMTLEDLQHIFDRQIEEGTEKLYFMLVDGDRLPVVQRHPSNELESLLPMLDHFQYAGNEVMPRFKK